MFFVSYQFLKVITAKVKCLYVYTCSLRLTQYTNVQKLVDVEYHSYSWMTEFNTLLWKTHLQKWEGVIICYTTFYNCSCIVDARLLWMWIWNVKTNNQDQSLHRSSHRNVKKDGGWLLVIPKITGQYFFHVIVGDRFLCNEDLIVFIETHILWFLKTIILRYIYT